MGIRDTEILVADRIDEDMSRVIGHGLDAFNDEVTGYADRLPLAVVAKDSVTGDILGGALGRTSLGLLFLDLFYLPAALRGRGLGARILQKFEEEGRQRGCRSAMLYTISFQAPKFYERHGWRAFGEIPCDPAGTSRIFMTKDLSAL
jgi:GNAT superfamily N-acetyltransferase